jgi:hypothetical protein
MLDQNDHHTLLIDGYYTIIIQVAVLFHTPSKMGIAG